jgi:integrase
MFLRDLLATYVANHEFGLKESSVGFLKAAIGSYERFIKRRSTVADFQVLQINQFLDWLRLNRKPDTFRTTRGGLLTLWKFAIEESLTSIQPAGLRKVRIKRRSPVAWTPEELTKLIQSLHESAEWSRSRMPCGVPTGIWWEAIIRTAYDTGMRLGDLLCASPKQINVNGESAVIRYIANKTGDEFFRSMRPRTWYAVQQAIMTNRNAPNLIWPLWGARDNFYVVFNRIVARAEIRKGTFRWIRRTAVTWADIVNPGLGQQVAGHKSERVTSDSYRDVTQIGLALPSPPDLEVALSLQQSRS